MYSVNTEAVQEEQPIIFDGWRSMSIAVYMALVGYGVLVGIPVISTAWVTLLGFSEVEVGRVAGADLGGLSLGAVLAAIVIGKMNRRLLVVIGVALAVAANAACLVMVEYQQVLWLRLLAGVGSGIYTAVAVATLGACSKPARAFNILLFVFAFSQALELHVLPQLSMNGIYLAFIGAYLIGMLFIHWVPPYPLPKTAAEIKAEQDNQAQAPTVPSYLPWLVLAAILATYINIGAYWTYIELASVDSEATPEWVGKVLVWASFCSIVGCLVATVISNRYGLARPLLVTLVMQAVIVVMLAGGINNTNIVISMFMFNFLWIFIDVYQMATVANVDHTGRFAALMPGAQGLGQILGANIAASILGYGLGYSAVFIMCGMASITAMLIYLTMYLRLRKLVPALADAS
ncbi:MAG: MFS transporter [Pseudomonadota bacterium]